jgi:oligoendopeptidase F
MKMKKEDNNKNKNKIPDFSHVERSRIPGEFTWNLTDIYPDIDAWEKDKACLLEMMDAQKIAAMARDWTRSPQKMFQLLNHVSETEKKEQKVYDYPGLFSDTDMASSTWQAMKGEVHTAIVNFESILTFIDPDILKLGKAKIEEYIKAEPRLGIYRMDFDSVLRLKKHILPSDREQIAAQTALFSEAPEEASGVLNDVDMPSPQITLSDGKKIKLNLANYIRFRRAKNRPDRVKVMHTFWRNHARFRNTHAVLLDGAVKNHFFNARVHRYTGCLEAALYPKNISPQVYYTLIDTVRANLGPLHRYLKLKARLLNLEKLSYDDIYASSVPDIEKEFTVEEAGEIILEALRPLGEEYTRILEQGLHSRWMDIYPNKAKRSGAYSNGHLYDIHPFVLMNYNGTFDSMSTLAHEFGHALHSWLSNKTQPYPTAHYPIFLAEIASTFNETLLVHHILETESDDLLKLYVLDEYLDGFRATLYRQTHLAEFELNFHREVEKGRTLTPDWLDHRYLELIRQYYGHKQGVVAVPDYIRNEWSNISHFYRNFYVYQYSTGIVAATALAEMVLNGGRTESQRYMNFLKSGGSKYPLDTLREAGVDLTTPDPIRMAIHRFDEVVGEMEAIVKRKVSSI